MSKVQNRMSLALLGMLCLLVAAGCDDAPNDGESAVSGQALLAAGAPLELIPSDMYPQYMMPLMVIGQPYNAPMTATGGSRSGHVWSLVDGVLPNGLSLVTGSPSALITGTPIVAGGSPGLNQLCKFRVVDSAGNAAERTVYFTGFHTQTLIGVSQPVLPIATANAQYEGFVTGWGGTWSGYQWSLVSGSLPPGLSLIDGSSTTGRVGGIPTVPGNYQFQLLLTDSAGHTATRLASMKVVAPTTRMAVYIPYANPAQPHTITFGYGTVPVNPVFARIYPLGGNGGIANWQIINGSLPADMHFIFNSYAADLVGEFNLSQLGTYQLTLRMTDSAGTSIDVNITINFWQAPPPPGTAGSSDGDSTTTASRLVATTQQCSCCGCLIPAPAPVPPPFDWGPYYEPRPIEQELAAADDSVGMFLK